MPAPETAYRRQKALLWAKTGYDDQGEPKRAAASVELDVRWLWKKTQAQDPQGNTISLDATVVVDREITAGGVMWLGSLADLASLEPGTGTGTDLIPAANLTTLYEVYDYAETPDLKGRDYRREVRLKRYKDTLPGTS